MVVLCSPHHNPYAEVETFNAGLAEVGGPKWREVLGQAMEAQRFATAAAETSGGQAASAGGGGSSAQPGGGGSNGVGEGALKAAEPAAEAEVQLQPLQAR